MFTKEPNKPEFTAEDIDRYLSGKMSPAERNALEKAAMEDPFLEEALEGFGSLPPGSGPADISALRDRLHRRISHGESKERRIVGIWWQAAAFIVLLGTAALWYFGRQTNRVRTVATTDIATKATAPAPATSADTSASVHIADSAQIVTAAPLTKAALMRARPRKEKAALVRTEKEASDFNNVQPATTFASDTNLAHARDSSAGLVSGSKPAPQFNFAPVRPADSFFITNQVTDIHNQPIAFATVKMENSHMAVSTDQNGFFHFPVADTNAVLSITAVGYQAQQFPAGEVLHMPSLQLKDQTTALNDVVVAGYGAKASPKRMAANGSFHPVMDSTSLEPEDGWDSYNDYLSSNLQIPEDVLHKNIHGDVDLSFQVDPSGKPVHISVVRSLCEACDAEAKRLLQQGPQWKKKDRSKARAGGRLKVRF